MTSSRPITPPVHADPIVCSEFLEGRNYTNWRPRGSGDWLLIGTLAGAGRIRACDQALRLGPGEVVLFGPHATQDYCTDPAAATWHLRWAHFVPRPHWRSWLRWPEVAPQTSIVKLGGPAWEAFAEALGRMLVARRIGGPHADDLAMNALEAALLWAHRVVSDDPATHLDPRLQVAVRHLATHPAEPFSMQRLASRCGLSASRLSHLFRAQLGVTPRRYSEQLRLALAAQLLDQTNLTITEVAAESGYADALYFSRRFHREFGYPPTRRRQHVHRAGGSSPIVDRR